MDLNRKVGFKSPVSDLQFPEEYDQDEADHVDCSAFWNKVNTSIIMRGLSKNMSDVPSVEPNLLQWSPFIGPKTRKGLMVMNTEHRKVHQENREIESDCCEVTEERLLELLQQATLKEVTSFMKQLGVKRKGSKLDIIMQIKRNSSKDNEMFKKAFEKLWGHSGGIVTAPCPHDVVYALKFVLHAESSRDYVDILLFVFKLCAVLFR